MGGVENPDLIDGLEEGVVGVSPDDLLLRREFVEVGFLAGKPVAQDGVSVGEALGSGDGVDGGIGKLFFGDGPDHLSGGIQLLERAAITAGDEVVAVGEGFQLHGSSGNRKRADDFPRGGEFEEAAIAAHRHEIVPTGELAGASELHVGGKVGPYGHGDLANDAAGAVDLYESFGATLADEHVAIRQGLSGMNLRSRGSLVFPDDLLGGGHLSGTGSMGEEDVSVGEKPAVLRGFGLDAPFDLAVGSDDADLSAGVIGAEEAVADGGVGGVGEGGKGKKGGESRKGGEGEGAGRGRDAGGEHGRSGVRR